jgi:Winged helix DNA-binding domain
MADGQVLSQRAVNRALLARQMLLDRTPLPAAGPGRAAQVARTIEHLVGLQAQAPFPPYYGLHSRLDGFRPEDLAAMITDRSVVRIALMRGTIHLVSARDCLPLRRLVQPVIERGMRSAYGKQLAGVDPAELAAAGRARLVAEFDNLVLSHAERSRVISPEATSRLYTINGVIPGTVLIDGFVAGMWRLTRSRREATVTIELFGPPRERGALAAEAGSVLAFAAPDAAHQVRFAPPGS